MEFGLSDGKQNLRLVQPKEIPSVEKLYAECRKALAAKGLDQWNDGYPGTDVIKNDIDRKCLWGFPDFSGVAVLNTDQDSQHLDISWEGSDVDCLFIHRLAVHPDHWGKGVGVMLVQQLEQFAQENGATSIRLDTYSLNESNLRFYEKLRYSRVPGEVFFQPHTAPFICFEKVF
jgi:GNAT superfamily N-acetyltransferase